MTLTTNARRRAVAWMAAAATAAALATGAAASAGTQSPASNPNTDGASAAVGVDTGSALVRFSLDPLTTASKTKPAPGKKVDFSSSSVKSYRAQLSAQRNDFKSWLRKNASGARVTGNFDVALNAVSVHLGGVSLAALRAGPGVAEVTPEYTYTPQAEDPDLALINAKAAWASATPVGSRGEGVKVAVVDTGIDVKHPCFSDVGYAAQTQLGERKYTNNKVIVARVFNNKAANQRLDAEAVQDHGTHVSGTVACNESTPATVKGAAIPYGVSGVAPRALLGNYNVFPGHIGNARSEDILNALQAAYEDGMDVANLSLGGPASGVQDLLTKAIDNLNDANMVVAVSAGNEGPGHYTVGSPGSAEKALTAGASSVGHFVGAPVTVNGAIYGAASGDFATVTTDLTALLQVVQGNVNGLSNACAPLASAVSGIVLISRGSCSFSTKIRNAQAAGAAAVLVANNVAGDPVAMAADGTPNQPTVPAYQVGLSSVPGLVAADGLAATIGAGLAYIRTPNDNIMAGFSSQGPTDVDWRVKPDVVAPGVNVLSSVPGSFCADPQGSCWAFFQGTSMASPHLAGTAAVLRAAHPAWTADQVRSAVVNTAQQGVLTNYQTGTTKVTDPNIVGAGLADVLAAMQATVALTPVSTSFGRIPSGSGQTRTATIAVSNLAGSADSVSVTGADAGLFTASLSNGVITVRVVPGKRAAPGDHSATLEVVSGTSVIAHSVLYVRVS